MPGYSNVIDAFNGLVTVTLIGAGVQAFVLCTSQIPRTQPPAWLGFGTEAALANAQSSPSSIAVVRIGQTFCLDNRFPPGDSPLSAHADFANVLNSWISETTMLCKVRFLLVRLSIQTRVSSP